MSDEPKAPTGFDPQDLIPFAGARDAVDAFAAALRAHGIEIAPGSDLEAVALIVREMDGWRLRPNTAELNEDIRVDLRRVAGLLELVKHVNAEYLRTLTLEPFVLHLMLLNEARQVAQNVPQVIDEATNKLFELFLGLLCSRCGTNLALDHPAAARGDNPDIMIDIENRRWGFACKVIEGQSPLSWFTLLEKGIDQIEKSEAEIGCVAFNLKNLIDHDALWPILNEEAYRAGTEPPYFGAWPHTGHILDYLKTQAESRRLEFTKMNTTEKIRQLFVNKKSISAALFFLPTAAWVESEAGPLLTTAHVFYLAEFERIPDADFRIFLRLNEALHHRAT